MQSSQFFAEQSSSGDEDAEHLAQLLPRSGDLISEGRYAKVDILRKYIPEADPQDPRAQTLRVKMAKKATMLKIQLGIALFVVALNIGTTIWAVIIYPPNRQGIGSIAFGSCHNLSLINTLLHGLINVLSSLILGAGSYCMQLLVGPSRREIDQAHAHGRSLEIGVASFKNLRHIAGKRSIIWAILGITSTLLHFFWNSTVFTSTPVVSVPRAIATSDFQISADNWTIDDPLLQRSWWRLPGIWGDVTYDLTPLYAMQTTASNMNRSEPKECLEQFIHPWKSTRSLLIVAQNVSSQQNNGSSLIDGWMSGWDIWTVSHGWICAAYQGPYGGTRSCTEEWASTFADEWIVPGAPSGDASSERQNVTVDYCLVGDTVDIEDRCGLHFSIHIMAIVCIGTTLEVLLIYLTWFSHSRAIKADITGQHQRTMVTVGDAISDFMERPDYVTDEHEDLNNVSETLRKMPYELRVGRWRDDRVSWFKAVSNRTWVVSISL
ncbi:hypothetical protein FVER53590_28836 [Fusarium verticillioides]|nr:hypothetical protein FVER53590_28836 [Fusarium verticillioides]